MSFGKDESKRKGSSRKAIKDETRRVAMLNTGDVFTFVVEPRIYRDKQWVFAPSRKAQLIYRDDGDANFVEFINEEGLHTKARYWVSSKAEIL